MNACYREQLRLRFRELRDLREASRAGAALGRLRVGYRANRARSKPKRWTGRMPDGTRAWWGRMVILPNGEVGTVCAVLRGKAAVQWQDYSSFEGVTFGLFTVAELRPFRHPAAVRLGAMKKGKAERPSIKKVIAARLNGLLPPKPGSKPRGRPRTAFR